jgi:hypothetical protein
LRLIVVVGDVQLLFSHFGVRLLFHVVVVWHFDCCFVDLALLHARFICCFTLIDVVYHSCCCCLLFLLAFVVVVTLLLLFDFYLDSVRCWFYSVVLLLMRPGYLR